MKKILPILTMLFCIVSVTAFGQLTVTGRVTSSQDGSPLPGVNVIVKGTATGTTTDSDGKYKITVPGQDAILVFSFIGFTSQEVAVGAQSVIDIAMQEDVSELGEVVVTALGIKREQRALGYSVSTVSADQLTNAGNTNFASALYGKAPGVRITTAPGGASSGVNVQIRGINSISYNAQPLYVVDGVMIRNINQAGSTGVNNDGYWTDQKIRGNGMLDINPADIESLTVLKGASAAALYGSEASSGVIVITTKKGTAGKGVGVDVNYVFNVEQAAFLPQYQNTYGPGYDRFTNADSFGANAEGFIPVDLDGNGINDAVRPIFRSWAQFGPKMDGREVAWWDGTMRKYSAHPDNYKDFYQTGFNSNFNVALSNSTDRASYRLSYTRMDYKSIARGSNMDRNTFNVNSTIKLHDKLTADVVVNYVNSLVHNRPELLNRVMANYGGFFSRADDMSVYLNKYQTSAGYKYVLFDQTQRNPAEAIPYSIRASDLLEYFWRNLRDSDDEKQDRLITSVTLNYQIAKNLKLRGRIGNDFTSLREDIKRHNDYPLAFNGTTSTGSYTLNQGRYSILYTDALLSYTKDLSSDLSLNISAGTQTREQDYLDQSIGTTNGLVVENWFSLENSFSSQKTVTSSRTRSFMYAYLGTVSLGFRNYLFLEATGRQEYNSTLPIDNNAYFYPSVNTGFVFTDAFQLPAFLSYGKVRASYAGVSNPPQPYLSNITYKLTTLSTTQGSVSELTASRAYGNDQIKPERKYETEFGLETRFLQNKVGLDVTYYTNTVKDQIIALSQAPSTGAISKLENLGELNSQGIEIGINATPYSSGGLHWDTRLTFARNRTKAVKLAEGLDEITFYNADGGAVLIKAEEGETLGNIYAHPRATDADGNFIISDEGLYTLSSDYKKVGNIQPLASGGWSNTVTYKGFTLNFLIDYRVGGKLVSPPLLYGTGAGMYKNTMQYRDEAHGGLPYNVDNDGNKVLAPDHASAEYHDGVLLKGVTTDGEENTKIVEAAYYYINSFYWSTGWYEKSGVYKNDYIKMREVSLGYNLPKSISDKLRFQNIRVSLIGRNLFYVYRTLKNLDPEVAVGSNWIRQGVDEGSMAATRSYGFSINASF